MKKTLSAFLLFIGATVSAFAIAPTAPEIDAGTGIAALALLAGGLLVLRSRRHK